MNYSGAEQLFKDRCSKMDPYEILSEFEQAHSFYLQNLTGASSNELRAHLYNMVCIARKEIVSRIK